MTEHFRRQLGVSPKAYARLLRFEHASALLSELPSDPGRTVADVAIAAGYYDQSHLTRDFTAMARHDPGRLRGHPGSGARGQVCPRPRARSPVKVGVMTMTNDTTTTNDLTGSASVIPVLVYEDIEAGHDYLVETFGFTSGGIHRTDDGTVVHAEVRMGDAAVWLHRVTEEHEMVSPKDSAMATAASR